MLLQICNTVFAIDSGFFLILFLIILIFTYNLQFTNIGLLVCTFFYSGRYTETTPPPRNNAIESLIQLFISQTDGNKTNFKTVIINDIKRSACEWVQIHTTRFSGLSSERSRVIVIIRGNKIDFI